MAIETKLASCGDGDDLVVVITPKLGTPAKWNHDPQWIYKRVGALRLQLAQKFADKHGRFVQTGTEADYKFAWVTDFPMYEWDEETKVWNAAHHPFTSPHEDDIKAGRLTSDKGAVRALAYDIVLNGTELGVGVDPYSPAGCAGGDLPVAGDESMQRRRSGSGSSWMLWSTARLRMAGLRWGWIGL